MTTAGARNDIRFFLSTRQSLFGRCDVVLRLYRGAQIASETVISTVPDSKARMMLLMSRMQLFRLGYDEHVLTLPQAEIFQIEAVRGRG